MNMSKTNESWTNSLRNISKNEFLTPFDKFFDDFFKSSDPFFSKNFGIDFFQKGAYPKIDVSEYDDRVVIEAGIPGLVKEDVSVEIDDRSLVISGNKQMNSENTSEVTTKHYRELKRSSFRRSFTLGENIDVNGAEATVENGLLKVVLKKIKPSHPDNKKIKIL